MLREIIPLSVGDTLTFWSGHLFYTAPWDGVVYTRDIDPWDLNITWYDGLDNQISTGTNNGPGSVSQAMIDSGFYVTAVYDWTYFLS